MYLGASIAGTSGAYSASQTESHTARMDDDVQGLVAPAAFSLFPCAVNMGTSRIQPAVSWSIGVPGSSGSAGGLPTASSPSWSHFPITQLYQYSTQTS